MTTTQHTIRFFTDAFTDTESCFTVEIVEITESCFNDLIIQSGGTAPIQYERHTVFDHGVAQVCLTLMDLDDCPHIDELELI